ncbi:MAG: DUF3090 family protein [Dehalococcoidia bacterium]
MPGELYDFGQVSYLDAEAVGLPGQRRFRLAAQNDEASASLWLEKEQLAALSTAMEQQLVRTRTGGASRESTEELTSPPFPLNPSVELQVGQLALGYDENRQLFIIQIYAAEANEDAQATFGCSLSRDQVRRLVRQISRLLTTGRPVCPLCGAPLQGAHVCPRSNGHAQVNIG